MIVDPDRDDVVQRPGDEWGDTAPLRLAYTHLLRMFGPHAGTVNVVEIGAGGGRSTSVMFDVLGDRAGDYHVVDVSAGFVEVLKERIQPPPTVHIVDDVDLSALPSTTSTSAWRNRRGRTSTSTTSIGTFGSCAR